FVVIPTIDLEIQLFVGLVMALYESRSILKLNTKYRITFLLYNLLTRGKNPVQLQQAVGFAQIFLRQTHVNLYTSFLIPHNVPGSF
ncbi:hypothetical protein ACO2KB_05755, partial [Leptospira interrogans]